MNIEIEKYINKRYARWNDYATYHCTQAGMPDECTDVLNEVLVSLLNKNEDDLLKLLNSKKNQYTELDFYVLRMIKFNATSNTAPYRARYKPLPVDRNVDYNQLDIIDEVTENDDNSAYIYDRMTDLRELIDDLYLGPNAMAIFEFKFFQDGDFKEWTGPETLKELYAIYSNIRQLIRRKTSGEIIF